MLSSFRFTPVRRVYCSDADCFPGVEKVVAVVSPPKSQGLENEGRGRRRRGRPMHKRGGNYIVKIANQVGRKPVLRRVPR